MKKIILLVLIFNYAANAQYLQWSNLKDKYYKIENGEIVEYELPENKKRILVNQQALTPKKETSAIVPKSLVFSNDESKILIFTNAQKVWRYETRGDYWLFDIKSKSLKKIGQARPQASLMFAKFSPDAKWVAYVSERNLYLENLTTGISKPLTQTNGNKKLINGTFDWAYEEEFDCRDGFRWSPDGKSIAFWQIDASGIKYFNMIDNTSDIYSKIIPIEYPKVGENPSKCRIGVVEIGSGKLKWMKIPGDSQQNYLPRMEWLPSTNEIIVQQLNRKQNTSNLYIANTISNTFKLISEEKEDTWIDVRNSWSYGNLVGWDWLKNKKDFIWVSEKDGWRHIYLINKDTKKETLITNGKYDIQKLLFFDAENDLIYFMASPLNATQSYLYKIEAKENSAPELVNPLGLEGTHNFDISPLGKYAFHSFSNHFTPRETQFVHLPSGQAINSEPGLLAKLKPGEKKVSFFQVTTAEGTILDGFIAKPNKMEAGKKYPILFLVYSEPAGTTVKDVYGIEKNRYFQGSMADDGYIYASIDGRGTPAPKGKDWRKSIYRKIGDINIKDHALGAKAMFEKFDFIDTSRVAVWGASGGGSATLNLLFQYPDIYKTGISMAAVANQLTYDNIYQERYMGIPQENKQDFVNGSPLSHVKNFRGNLLYIHGTGDDNVHYQNAEMLLNEMIKHNKQFSFMPYPNRSHSISEGEGTFLHLSTLYTQFLKKNCPPGGR
jgi:dipeptidyl-peptidase-4